MTTTAAPKSLGTPGRTFWLVGMLLALSGATFANETIHQFSFVPRYVAAVALVLTTWHQGRDRVIKMSDLPGPGRTFFFGSWSMVGLAFFSSTWSVDPEQTLLQAGVYTLIVLLVQVHALRRWHVPGTLEADARVIFWTLGATVIISLATGVTVGGTRLGGLYDNPNTLGILSAYCVALGFGLWAKGRSGLILVAIVLCGVALSMSENRTGIVGIVVAFAWLALRRARSISPVAVIAACFTSATALALLLFAGRVPLPAFASRFTDTPAADGGVLAGRQDGWRYAIELWHRQPLTGYGFRVGETVFQRERFLTTFTADGAHNSYLQTLLELGYLGLVPLFIIVFAVVRGILRRDLGGIQAGMMMLAVTGLAVGVTESALFGVGQNICWVFWIASAALCTAPASTQGNVHEPKQVQRIVGGIEARSNNGIAAAASVPRTLSARRAKGRPRIASHSRRGRDETVPSGSPARKDPGETRRLRASWSDGTFRTARQSGRTRGS